MTTRDQWLQQLDQDWADAREFIGRTDAQTLMQLAEFLADDDTTRILRWMRLNPRSPTWLLAWRCWRCTRPRRGASMRRRISPAAHEKPDLAVGRLGNGAEL